MQCWQTHLTNHPTNRPTDRPTNRPTDQPTNQPADRPTKQLHIGHQGLSEMPNRIITTSKVRLGRKNMVYTTAQKSPLSELTTSVSPQTHDQDFEELLVKIARTSGYHIREPRIFQQKTCQWHVHS